ncbi:arginine deiminase [Actinomycetospora sp. TBRC 11914]|uniref:arginine deiminase n=1 Tax=Actinomycetospora sp. TBRC 11914 TaxID=2729387 RepID=UPI00145D400D|nr:arginine deiminase [Actinomycetospora sp. TBRC 11914]NMO90119.1 arginine deiminase [Actinomycetospora sp. TBRC 11914]
MTPPRVDSEVGPLRTVVLHRPGPELERLTPRNADRLLFDGIPWVERAQLEHDRFAATLERHGVRVLLLADLLRTALDDADARERGIADAVDERVLGRELGDGVRAQLTAMGPDDLAEVLIGGLTFRELGDGHSSLVRRMHGPDEFAVDPLPNLMFTRDSSIRVGDHVVAAAMGMPARRREAALVALAQRAHAQLGGVPHTDPRDPSPVEGGDVLLLAPGVLAVGVGERTSPAGAESFARAMFDAELAHTVLAVPITQRRATMHLDTVATMVDVDTLVVFPEVLDSLQAWTITPDGAGLAIAGPEPFRPAAAAAMGIEELRAVDTGPAGVAAEREQWDDGNNTLALAPGLVVAYERNTTTNGRLRDAGIEVVTIEGFELGSGRGGPRCLSCPWERAPAS